MFDDLAYLAPGGHENSQRLLLQALWSLEDASECHDKLIQKAKKLSRGPTAFELDASVVGLSMKRALSDLSLLHLCLFKGQFLDEFETFCGRRPKARRKPKALVWKPRPRLHREDALQGRPGLDPRILQLKSLVKYNILNSSQLLGSSIVQKDSLTISVISQNLRYKVQPIAIDVSFHFMGEPVKMKISGSYIIPRRNCNNPINYELIREEQFLQGKDHESMPPDDNSSQTSQSPTIGARGVKKWQKFPPDEGLHTSPDEDANGIATSTNENAAEPLPTQDLISLNFSRSHIIIILLKQLRQLLERRHEEEPDGIPLEIIASLHEFEVAFDLERHPSTNSVWNLDHHRQRIEASSLSDIGIAYKLKCSCLLVGDGGLLDSAIHRLDFFCPRNIPINISNGDQDLEWDSTELEYRKKKTKRPTSPVDNGAESRGVDEADEQEEEKRAENERKEKTEKYTERIMSLVGLQNVKEHIHKLKAMVESSTRLNVGFKSERFGTVFLGNPGTGKTSVARSFAKFLGASGIVADIYKETTGIYLADGGIERAKDYIEELDDCGGVLLVDDAHQLIARPYSYEGKKVLGYLLQEVERRRGRIIFIFAGDEKEMRKLLGRGNVGSLFPHTHVCKDFSDDELLELLKSAILEKFKGKLSVEGGLDGIYMRIAVRRLGKIRGSAGFGNAMAVENLLAQIWARQSARRSRERLEMAEVHALASMEEDKPTPNELNNCPEDFKFTKEDIIGPAPTDAVLESFAWKALQRLTGLANVKQSILSIFELAKTNYQRELEEKPPLELSFNRLFLGPPGTGKTVVAKLYGQILADIGVLSKGQMIVKTPNDLIGEYIGHSEANTKVALASAVGNVLVIDEAYMTYSGDSTGNKSDSFRQGVIDTIVGEVQSTPGEDRCVLLLGYGEQMQEMLQNSNPGLSRRFPIADAFWFHSFGLEELESILRAKLGDYAIKATDEGIKVAMDVLEKARSRLNFGNGGEVENLITKAKTNYQTRISLIHVSDRPEQWVFEPQDFDPQYDRGRSATLNLYKLFGDVIGCDAIVKKLEQYQRVSQVMKLKNIDSKSFIPTNFVFKGPPGTGKTTTARKLAQVYYDMGFLAEATVVECSASDLVGKYIGHSGPKTVKMLERGLGKVLFIDEAYRLSQGSDRSSYSSEVISELVDCLTKPKFHGKMVVVLAGYEGEMNQLLSVNPGLASRFPEELMFPSLSPKHCLEILKKKLQEINIATPVLIQPTRTECQYIVELMAHLIETPNWGNARDVETLAKAITREVFMSVRNMDDELICTEYMLSSEMEILPRQRSARVLHR